MTIWEALLFGVIEGITEFLPISSTGHLTIAEKLLGYSIDDPDITAFTAIIQVGAVLATLLYFRKDIIHIVSSFVQGIVRSDQRSAPAYRYGWAIILGSIPIAVVGLIFKDQIETVLRSLWFVGASLLLWSGVMLYADRKGKQDRAESSVTWRDTLIIGVTQCLALIPGISRSGATMSAGLLRGLDRVTVTKLSFFLSIPALMAAGALQTVSEYKNISSGVGWMPTIVATVTSFVVAYMAVAWLLKYIAGHSYTVFIAYRVILGSAVLIALSTGMLQAT
jgi:undecaprenyl-diphosphatase